MAKRIRPPEAIKKQIAKRFHKGEDPELLAGEYHLAVSTIKDYAGMFPKASRKVKRKIKPTENTRVSNAETQGLRDEVQRLRGLLLDEILRNRGS